MNFPLISYHGGHTGDTCDHAQDTKAAVLEAYVASGFTHLGISEHLAPPGDALLFPEELEFGHDAAFLRARLDEYFFETCPRLRQAFGHRLQLALGFETEWYGAAPAQWLETNVERYSPDYIVASAHHVRDIPIDVSQAKTAEAIEVLGGVEALYLAYYDCQHDLFSALAPYASRLPVIVAHFDLVKLFTPDHEPSDAVWERIVRNLELAIANEFVFEVNARAFKKGLGEPYPSAHLLNQIHDMGGEITLGDDSHAVAEVGLHFDRAVQVLRPMFRELTAFEWEGGKLNKVYLPLEMRPSNSPQF